MTHIITTFAQSTVPVTFPDNIHLKIDAEIDLHNALDSFKEFDEIAGYYNFRSCLSKSPEHGFLTYYFLWIIHNQPKGDLEYGKHAFWKLHGKNSTLMEKIKAIEMALMKIDDHRKEIQGNFYYNYVIDNDEDKVDSSFTFCETLESIGLATAAMGTICLLVSQFFTKKAISPTRIIPGHVVVGGGHMDSAVQKLALNFENFSNCNSIKNESEKYVISKKCEAKVYPPLFQKWSKKQIEYLDKIRELEKLEIFNSCNNQTFFYSLKSLVKLNCFDRVSDYIQKLETLAVEFSQKEFVKLMEEVISLARNMK